MAQAYDLIVIGTGTAGAGVAMRVRAGGRRVAIVDERPPGGTCALRGCDPKKMLMGGAAAVDHANRMRGRGIAGETQIEWAGLMAAKRELTDPVPARREQTYRERGIDFHRGVARFSGADTLEVDGRPLRARQFVIATGAEPAPLDIEGGAQAVTSEEFLSLPAPPARLVLIGGGYIAAEFSHIAARAGSRVIVLQHGESMLKGFEPELVGWLMRKFERIGIEVHTEVSVDAIEKLAEAYTVHAATPDGRASFTADLVVHAAGRVPALRRLNLGAAGIELDGGRLQLNEYLQSVSNPAVYAAGDAAQAGPPLTPVASLDAGVVAANLLEGNHRRADYDGVPSVVFTVPPLARVGLGEKLARERGLKFRSNCKEASSWFTARQAAEPVYGYKVLIEEGSDRILGAHLVGPHADEVINLFALAVRHGLTAADLRSSVFAYPTAASDIGSML